MVELAELYREGGFIMDAIAIVAAIGSIVVLERVWWLVLRARADVPHLMTMARVRLMSGDPHGAALILVEPTGVIGPVLRAGVRAAMGREDRGRTTAMIREAQMEANAVISPRLSLLSSLASIAMLLGLLGTVFGMIMGFSCPAVVSADLRIRELASSISLAIGTTGFGLMVGIPLLAARLWLGEIRCRLEADIALCGARLVELVELTRPLMPPR